MMNEELVKLAMQANSQTGNKFDLNHKELDAFLSKFSELIVKECVDIVRPDYNSGDEWCKALHGAANEIEVFFGIKS